MPTIRKFRIALILFMLGLVLSGVTAFPLGWETRFLADALHANDSPASESYSGLAFWISTVNRGLNETYSRYPWVAYGTDWLAFAHIAIAVYFIGPLINPVKNEWVIRVGLIGCLLVLPWVLVCGPLRGIPLYWRLIDCSFGVFGALPLLYCLHLTRLMKKPAGE